eukprot:7308868-Prymnesium_polylepis.1
MKEISMASARNLRLAQVAHDGAWHGVVWHGVAWQRRGLGHSVAWHGVAHGMAQWGSAACPPRLPPLRVVCVQCGVGTGVAGRGVGSGMAVSSGWRRPVLLCVNGSFDPGDGQIRGVFLNYDPL